MLLRPRLLGWGRFFSPHGLRKLARMALLRSCIIFRLISFVDASGSCQTPNACDRRRSIRRNDFATSTARCRLL